MRDLHFPLVIVLPNENKAIVLYVSAIKCTTHGAI